jgi:hypothetical protein
LVLSTVVVEAEEAVLERLVVAQEAYARAMEMNEGISGESVVAEELEAKVVGAKALGAEVLAAMLESASGTALAAFPLMRPVIRAIICSANMDLTAKK